MQGVVACRPTRIFRAPVLPVLGGLHVPFWLSFWVERCFNREHHIIGEHTPPVVPFGVCVLSRRVSFLKLNYPKTKYTGQYLTPLRDEKDEQRRHVSLGLGLKEKIHAEKSPCRGVGPCGCVFFEAAIFVVISWQPHITVSLPLFLWRGVVLSLEAPPWAIPSRSAPCVPCMARAGARPSR